MTAFHEILFPLDIALKSAGGPQRRTDVVALGSGAEERNARWAHSRRRYDAGYGVKTYDALSQVIAFFEERRGRLYGFRWRDRLDHSSAAPDAAVAATDQAIGTGDGTTATFALAKTYGSLYSPYQRPIAKPLAGSVRVVRCRPGTITGPCLKRSRISGAPLRAAPHPEHVRFSMRSIPTALQVKLDSGVTTLCRCWLIARNDGVTQGFTEHDEDIVIGDVTCRAGSGLTGSEATAKLGMAVDGSEISGALADDSLNEDDLAAGRYDAAGVELWLVDWSEPDLRVLLAKGSLGEVKREGTAFTAEVRGLSQRLAEDSGRLFTATCSADLGDARCTVDLADAAYHGSGTVLALSAVAAFTASGLDAFAEGRFSAGKLTFTGGANAGLAVEVKSHGNSGGRVSFTLWQAMAQPIQSGDTFTVSAGCDKRFATCLNRFNNAVNFRGFPHIPGNDFIIRYPVAGEPGNDGSSLQS